MRFFQKNAIKSLFKNFWASFAVVLSALFIIISVFQIIAVNEKLSAIASNVNKINTLTLIENHFASAESFLISGNDAFEQKIEIELKEIEGIINSLNEAEQRDLVPQLKGVNEIRNAIERNGTREAFSAKKDSIVFSVFNSLILDIKKSVEQVRSNQAVISRKLSATWKTINTILIVSCIMAAFMAVLSSLYQKDLSRLKVIENRAKKNNKFLEAIVENIPNMIFIKEADNLRFVRFNKAGEELLGYKRSDLLGKNDYDFFSKEQADFFTLKDKEVLSEGNLHTILEEAIDTKSKGRRYLETKKIPIFGEEGKPAYLLGISNDITEKKEALEKIVQLNIELEKRVKERTAQLTQSNEELVKEIELRKQTEISLRKSESQKDEYIKHLEDMAFITSHKIRAPLAHILGLSDILNQNLTSQKELKKIIAYFKDSIGNLDLFTHEMTNNIDIYKKKILGK